MRNKLQKIKYSFILAMLTITLLITGTAYAAETSANSSAGLNLDVSNLLGSVTGILGSESGPLELGGTLSGVTGTLSGVLSGIPSKDSSLLNIGETLSGVTGTLSGVLSGISGGDSSLLDVSGTLGPVTETVGTVGTVVEQTGGLLPALTDTLGDSVSDIEKSVGGLVTDLTGLLGNTLKGLGNAGGTIVVDVGKTVQTIGAPGASTGTTAPAGKKRVVVVFKIGSKHYTINGKAALMDVAPYIKHDRTYLPFRFVGYSLGITPENVHWDQANKKATLVKGNTTVQVVIGGSAMLVNNTVVQIDAPVELVPPGRTMLPYRWIAEAFGATVNWEPNTRTVTIEYYE